MKKKWLVLSDYVISRNDGDKHFITCEQLCRLYQVNPKECVFGKVGDGKRYPNLPILVPRYDGNYSLPTPPATCYIWYCAEFDVWDFDVEPDEIFKVPGWQEYTYFRFVSEKAYCPTRLSEFIYIGKL